MTNLIFYVMFLLPWPSPCHPFQEADPAVVGQSKASTSASTKNPSKTTGVDVDPIHREVSAKSMTGVDVDPTHREVSAKCLKGGKTKIYHNAAANSATQDRKLVISGSTTQDDEFEFPYETDYKKILAAEQQLIDACDLASISDDSSSDTGDENPTGRAELKIPACAEGGVGGFRESSDPGEDIQLITPTDIEEMPTGGCRKNVHRGTGCLEGDNNTAKSAVSAGIVGGLEARIDQGSDNLNGIVESIKRRGGGEMVTVDSGVESVQVSGAGGVGIVGNIDGGKSGGTGNSPFNAQEEPSIPCSQRGSSEVMGDDRCVPSALSQQLDGNQRDAAVTKEAQQMLSEESPGNNLNSTPTCNATTGGTPIAATPSTTAPTLCKTCRLSETRSTCTTCLSPCHFNCGTRAVGGSLLCDSCKSSSPIGASTTVFQTPSTGVSTKRRRKSSNKSTPSVKTASLGSLPAWKARNGLDQSDQSDAGEEIVPLKRQKYCIVAPTDSNCTSCNEQGSAARFICYDCEQPCHKEEPCGKVMYGPATEIYLLCERCKTQLADSQLDDPWRSLKIHKRKCNYFDPSKKFPKNLDGSQIDEQLSCSLQAAAGLDVTLEFDRIQPTDPEDQTTQGSPATEVSGPKSDSQEVVVPRLKRLDATCESELKLMASESVPLEERPVAMRLE